MADVKQINVISNVGAGAVSNLRNELLDCLAQVLACDRAELDVQIAIDGDVKTDSAQAETVIAMMEDRLGRELPGPADLRPEQFSSVNSLLEMVTRKLDR